jgi:hypothetical protein
MKKLLFFLLLATAAFGQANLQGTGFGFFPYALCSPFSPPEITLCPMADGWYGNTTAAPNVFTKIGSGAQGPKGDTGAQGPQGLQGVAGPQGAQGLAGAPGPVGPTGPAGATGAQGPAGTAPASFTCTSVVFSANGATFSGCK